MFPSSYQFFQLNPSFPSGRDRSVQTFDVLFCRNPRTPYIKSIMQFAISHSKIDFQNTLQVSSAKFDNMIVTKPNVEWGFQCTYDTEYKIGESLTVNAAAISQSFSQTNAQFAFSFDFYTDGTFADIQDTATYLVGQRLNFGGIYPYFHTLR